MKLLFLGFKAALAFVVMMSLVGWLVILLTFVAELLMLIADKLDNAQDLMMDKYGSPIRKWWFKCYREYKDAKDPQWKEKEQQRIDDLFSDIG